MLAQIVNLCEKIAESLVGILDGFVACQHQRLVHYPVQSRCLVVGRCNGQGLSEQVVSRHIQLLSSHPREIFDDVFPCLERVAAKLQMGTHEIGLLVEVDEVVAI